MAIVTGVGGAVTLPGGELSANFNRWTASFDREVFDVTSFDDSGSGRVKLGGLHDLKFTAEAYLAGAAPALGTMVTEASGPTAGFLLRFKSGSSNGYSFSGIINNVSPVVERKGIQTCTISGESSGPVALATS